MIRTDSARWAAVRGWSEAPNLADPADSSATRSAIAWEERLKTGWLEASRCLERLVWPMLCLHDKPKL